MHCPFCHAPASETQLQCGACGFTLERVDLFFGVMPRLHPGLCDVAPLFGPRDCRMIRRAINRLADSFPQVGFSIVTTSLDVDQPISAYAFWIFNRGGVCRELQRGGRNHDILLTLDATNARAALIIGYGLEPFVSAAHLQRTLEAGSADFAAKRWVDGVIAVVQASGAMLTEVCAQLPRAFGIDMESVRREEDPALTKAQLAGVY
ncbi:MAG: TPM domain-containing protein [Verrucomicrobiales bacterium]